MRKNCIQDATHQTTVKLYAPVAGQMEGANVSTNPLKKINKLYG